MKKKIELYAYQYDKNTLHIDNCIVGFGFGSCERLSNAPQSWCYVEDVD